MNKVLKRTLVGTAWVIGPIIIGLTVLVGIVVYSLSDNRSPRPQFDGYTSTIPLGGSSVIAAELDYSTEGVLNIRHPIYRQTYSSGAVLLQRKSQESFAAVSCKTKLEAKPQIEGYTYECRGGSLKSGSEYSIEKTYYRGELSGMYVSALINGTYMYISAPDEIYEELLEYSDWQRYFDAMQPINLAPPEPPTVVERIFNFLVFRE